MYYPAVSTTHILNSSVKFPSLVCLYSLTAINRSPIGSGVSLYKERFCGASNNRGIPITPHSDR